jgi:hypothetical protein
MASRPLNFSSFVISSLEISFRISSRSRSWYKHVMLYTTAHIILNISGYTTKRGNNSLFTWLLLVLDHIIIRCLPVLCVSCTISKSL